MDVISGDQHHPCYRLMFLGQDDHRFMRHKRDEMVQLWIDVRNSAMKMEHLHLIADGSSRISTVT